MASAPATSTDFLDLVRKAGILPAEAFDSLPDLPKDPISCASTLIAKGHITKFQAKLLLGGKYKGFKLGSYIVREQIGQGGMGAVYLGEHETLRRRVALKVLTFPKGENNQLALERFIREARSAAALDHPNIVRLHDISKSGETHFIVMEYVDGQSLEQLAEKSGCMAPSRAVTFIAQAAAGLQHAYEKGFVHRDIKPGNLMLAKDGTVKILDMGLARAVDTSAADKLTEILDKGAVVGTADYISPEQAVNGPVDIRSDIYSLGATFFALVTGQPPFNGNTTQKLLQHQMKEAPSILTIDKTFPPGLAEVVSKMLAKKPTDRYQTPSEVIAAVAEWLPADGGRRVLAGITGTDLARNPSLQNTLDEVVHSTTKRIGSKPRINTKANPNRKLIIGGGLAIAVLAVGGLIGALLGGGNKKPDAVTQASPPAGMPVVAPVEKPIPPKTVAKADVPKPTPAYAKTPAGTLVQLPVSEMKPFSIQISRNPQGTTPPVKELLHGEGTMPPMWYKWIENYDREAMLSAEATDGGMAFVLRGTKGTGGYQINSPEIAVPTEGKITITVQYKTGPLSTGGVIRFRTMKPAGLATREVVSLAPTANAWQTITREVTLKDSTHGLFELATSGTGPEAALFFKVFAVSSNEK